MRASRVIYVENDPALRGIMTQLLSAHGEIEVVLATGTPQEALASEEVLHADVALIDLALGAGHINGVELGIALRERNPELGIVIHSQYPLDFATERVPRESLIGWSTMPKTGDLRIGDVVALLRSTASGVTTIDADPRAPSDEASRLARLNARQRSVMSMLVQGFNAAEIAQQLGSTHEAVRQDLSRAYRILVPDASAGSDRRTQAVLEYVRLTGSPDWDDR